MEPREEAASWLRWRNCNAIVTGHFTGGHTLDALSGRRYDDFVTGAATRYIRCPPYPSLAAARTARILETMSDLLYWSKGEENDCRHNYGMSQATLGHAICRYYERRDADPDSRYRSWEHCYGFFQEHFRDLLQVEDTAALQLAFYLASWGMYRGSSFLLQRTHTAHLPVIQVLASPQFSNLWRRDIGTHDRDVELTETIMDLVVSVKAAYIQFDTPTDTLATKVVLGTVGCLPACDRYFIKGFRQNGLPYSSLNRRFVDRILQFVVDNRIEIAKIQAMIIDRGGPKYPLMKLVDMHFWQIGYDLEDR